MKIKTSIIISTVLFLLAASCEPEVKDPVVKRDVREVIALEDTPCPDVVGNGIYTIKSIKLGGEPRKMKQWVDCHGKIHSEILPLDYDK